jgi:hypothetical protein
MVDASSVAMLRTVLRLTLIALAGTVGAGARLAHGQPAKPAAASAEAPSDPDLNAAKAEFEEGQDFFKRGQYAEAVAKFQSAYSKKPFGPFLFNTGAAFEMAGKYAEAVEYYSKYLEKEPDAQEAKDVTARIEALKALIKEGDKHKRPATRVDTKGLVIIDSKPAGALIYLDDKKNGVFAKTPWQGSLSHRDVKIIVEAKGYKPAERTISPRTDKVYEIYFGLEADFFLAWIEVASNVPGAFVYLDKKEIGAVGKTPYSGHVKPGKHTIWLEAPGYEPAHLDIEASSATANTHMINMEEVKQGWIEIVGKQSKGGHMKVDGQPACDTPCRFETAPGKHKVVVSKEGLADYKAELNVERSRVTQVEVTWVLPRPRDGAWKAAVVSALFLGGGIYAAVHGRGIKNDLQKDINGGKFISTSDERGNRGKYWYYGADAAFLVATVAGGLAAYGFLVPGPVSPGDVETKRLAVAPAPMGLGVGGGLFALGSF